MWWILTHLRRPTSTGALTCLIQCTNSGAFVCLAQLHVSQTLVWMEQMGWACLKKAGLSLGLDWACRHKLKEKLVKWWCNMFSKKRVWERRSDLICLPTRTLRGKSDRLSLLKGNNNWGTQPPPIWEWGFHTLLYNLTSSSFKHTEAVF